MSNIPDFTESEQALIRTTLKERYGREAEFKLVDARIRQSTVSRTSIGCQA